MRNNNFKNKLFLKLFTSYMVSVLIPISLIGILTSTSIFQIIKKDYVQLNTHIIDQYQNDINLSLKTQNILAIQLSNNTTVKNYLKTKFSTPSSKTYNAKEVANELSSYNITTDLSYSNSFGIYSFLNNVIICANSIYTPEEYFDFFCKDISCSYKDWLKILKSIQTQTYIPSNTNSKIFHFNPLYRDDSSAGVLINIISHQSLFKELNTISTKGDLQFMIFDKNGKQLMSLHNSDQDFNISLLSSAEDNFSITQNGKKFVGKYSLSNTGNLIYVYLIENGNIFSNTNIITFAFLGLIFICLIFCTYIAYRNTLSSYHPFNNVLNEKELLSLELDNQRNLMCRSVLSNLVYGTKNYTQENLHDYGIDFSMKYYSVLILNTVSSHSEIESDELINSIIINKVDNVLKQHDTDLYLVSSNDRKHICILNYNESFLNSIANDFIEHIYNEYNIQIVIAGGTATENFNNLSYSFDTASIAMNYALRNDILTYCKYDDIKNKLSNNASFQKEKKDALLSLVKTGQSEKVADLIDEIYNTYFVSNQLDNISLISLNKRLFASLLDLLEETKLNENTPAYYASLILNAMEQKNPYESFNCFRDLCLEICRQSSSLTNFYKRTLNEVFSYIEKNYANSALSLRDVSDYLDVNYSLLSRRIKTETGTSFIEHLNKYRLKQASLLLKDTTRSIESIAKAVGYDSLNTFSKTFKKYYSQTPTQYRNSFSENTL